MLNMLLALSLLPFNPEYTIRSCVDNDIVVLNEFKTILEYSNGTPIVFEQSSIQLRGIISPACNRLNAKVTVSFDVDDKGRLVNYKTLEATPKKVTDREVKKALFKGKVIQDVYGKQALTVTVHYLQFDKK